ncbi:serine O-acetyltransferase [Enterococcus casseliflavus]|uniref:serine O-acetyltransferase n=1 Tax=Enterococcus casseliflavus TaxID=37734 RepID=UPI0022E8624A|nr:hypothetical protein [Enterococcus casseliflavus]
MSIFKELLYWKNNSPSKSYLGVLINPNYHSLIVFRFANFLYRHKVLFLPKILWYINRIIFSIDIDYRASIGKNFMIIHGIGIVIGKNVVIGKNCKVYQNCTLGGNGKSKKIDNVKVTMPIIGNNTAIYSNSTIIGPVLIGNNVIIGAATTIVKDIPDNVIVYEKKNIHKVNIHK